MPGSAGGVFNHEVPNELPHAQAELQQQHQVMQMDVDDYDDYYVPPHHDGAFLEADDAPEGVVAGDIVATGPPAQDDDLILGVVDFDADPIFMNPSSDEGSEGDESDLETMPRRQRPQRWQRLQRRSRVVMIQKSPRRMTRPLSWSHPCSQRRPTPAATAP